MPSERAKELWTRIAAETQTRVRLLGAERDTGSWIGGAPDLPEGTSWPRWEGAPLAFIAQIDLAQAPHADMPDWAPKAGRLVFFFEADQGGSGFDPSDRGSGVVLHIAAETPLVATLPPDDLSAKVWFKRKPLRFVAEESFQSYERAAELGPRLSERDWTWLQTEIEKAEVRTQADGPQHALFGWPAPIQGDDMEIECQLASNGVSCGDASYLKHPDYERLKSGIADWTLLLQIDTDDDAQMMWGDAGRLYFWVRREEAAHGDFSNVWTVLQCY